MEKQMENHRLRKPILTSILSIGTLAKAFAMQSFSKKKFELTPIQFVVLNVITNNDGLYQRQISTQLLKDRPNVTRIVNILEKKELIKRIPDTYNRKVFKIYPTEKGRELHKIIEPTIINIQNMATQGISDDEIEICLDILKRIHDNIIKKTTIQI